MSAPKRRASPTLMGLLSPHHSSAALMDSDLEGAASLAPRRSKRIRLSKDLETSILEEKTVQKPVSVKVEDIEGSDDVSLKRGASSKRTKTVRQANASSPRKAKPIRQALDIPHPAPTGWREAYDSIKEMRSHIVAPVDTMGCEQAQLKETDPQVRQCMGMLVDV